MLTQTTNAQPRTIRQPALARHRAAEGPLVGVFDLLGAPMAFGRNEEIYGEYEPADYLYKVAEGAVRTYKVLSDGRRQIGAFYLPGDIFGLEHGDKHAFSAEAIGETRLLLVKRHAIEELADRDAETARQLWGLTRSELQRAQNHLILLIKTARERVASFILEMAERLQADDEVALPMSRQDIADHLGLTIETVSRTLTGLEGSATIALPSSRRVVLRSPGALRRING